MTRKEEAINKILEFIDIVKDVPKNESILAIGMDMVEWADSTAWKPADGDNLPEIDREVIAIVKENDHYKVVFAHRPPEYWDGRNILTNEVTRNYTERYDKGGWNQPNVKWWLDLELPKMEMEKL